MAAKELVDAVRKHAREHYEDSYGWSEIIECWEDREIAELLDGDVFGPVPMTPEDAIRKMGQYVDAKNERYREAVGPDVPCGICGTMFPENTVCPHEGREDHRLHH